MVQCAVSGKGARFSVRVASDWTVELSVRMGSLVEPLAVIAGTLRDYLRIDRYIVAVILVFALLYVPTIPRAVDNSTMLATATNDDPWMAMALDGSIQRPFGNPANYFDPELAAHKSIPPYWGALRYDGIIYYGGAVFMLATPVYAVARLLGFPPFPTGPIILRIVSVVGGLLSLIVLYNFAVRNGMRWAGLLASVYLMTDYQFGMWTRMAHPDTLQVLFALFGLVIGLRHAERGDLASLAALGLMCGFVQGAKSGGPWTVPMAFLALLWGLQAAGHKFSAVKPFARPLHGARRRGAVRLLRIDPLCLHRPVPAALLLVDVAHPGPRCLDRRPVRPRHHLDVGPGDLRAYRAAGCRISRGCHRSKRF